MRTTAIFRTTCAADEREVQSAFRSEETLLAVIVGPSGSGKSTLARAVFEELRGTASVVSQDDFLIPEPDRRSAGLLAKYDFEQMHSAVRDLMQGRRVSFTPFDQQSRTRAGSKTVEPNRVVLVEGVTAAFCGLLRTQTHLGVYVDAPRGLREQRQIQRARDEGHYRGISEQELLARVVSKERFEVPIIRRQRAYCDLVVLNTRVGIATVGHLVKEALLCRQNPRAA
jgi:uridine kinase